MTRPQKNDATPAQGDVAGTHTTNPHDTRAARLTALFTAAPRVDVASRADVLEWAGRLMAEGLYLFPVREGTKVAALKAWQVNATNDPAVFASMYSTGQNIGIHLGKSGLIVLDADTPDEVAAVTAWAVDEGVDLDDEPTVVTPGQQGDEKVEHHGGGHRYYLADVDLTGGAGTEAVGDMRYTRAAAMTGNAYVLAPGSARDNAHDPAAPAYRVTGAVHPAPGALVDLIVDGIATREQYAAERDARRADWLDRVASGEENDYNTAIDEWSLSTPWADILTPHGWSLSTSRASCGCENYARPGHDASHKSATAHDGCDDLHGKTVLKVFSSNAAPFRDDRAVSKFEAFALLNHDGDFADAGRALDFPAPVSKAWGLTREGQPVEVIDDVMFTVNADGTREPFDPADLIVDTARAVNIGDDAALWTARPWLDDVRRAAFIRGVDPYAVLIVVLSEVALRVPSSVVLGGIRTASLNLFVMLLGESGHGKGVARSLGMQLVDRADGNQFAADTAEPVTRTGFSGQGFARAMEPVTVDKGDPAEGVEPTTSPAPPVRFVVTEVQALVALFKQTGSTHIGTLNAAFMGEDLGATNSEAARTFSTPAHTYRAALQVEAQPAIAAPLFEADALESGLTSRLLSARVLIPKSAARARLDMLADGRLSDPGVFAPVVHVPSSAWSSLPATPAGLRVYPTDDDVEYTINEAALEARYSDDPGARTRSHEALRRRKVAALLAIASGEQSITAEWWELAGYVMKVNRTVTTDLYRERADARERAEVNALKAEERRRERADVERFDERVKAVAAWLAGTGAKYADGDGWVKWSKVVGSGPMKRVKSGDVDAVLDALAHGEHGVEVAESRSNHPGCRVRLSP